MSAKHRKSRLPNLKKIHSDTRDAIDNTFWTIVRLHSENDSVDYVLMGIAGLVGVHIMKRFNRHINRLRRQKESQGIEE